MAQLIPDGMIKGNAIRIALIALVARTLFPKPGLGNRVLRTAPSLLTGVLPSTERTFTDRLQKLWEEGKAQDKDFEQLADTIRRSKRVFPADLSSPVKVSVSDYTIDENGYLRFRGRLWVPNYEPLRTVII